MSSHDPERLEGLLQFAREHWQQPDQLAQVAEYVKRMRQRMLDTWQERNHSYQLRRSTLNAELSGLIESNLAACQAIATALSDFLDQPEEPALDRFQAGIAQFFESSDRLSALARSQQPLCPACGSSGPEALCPSCQVDRLIPDPDFRPNAEDQAEVNEEFLNVFQAYQALLEGRGTLTDLADALQPLEFTLLEAQALAEQGQEDQILASINQALEGLMRMHAVVDNRRTSELHAGWIQIFQAAKFFGQL